MHKIIVINMRQNNALEDLVKRYNHSIGELISSDFDELCLEQNCFNNISYNSRYFNNYVQS